ncbi:phospholipid carrier-dependent glycosyltransferase, partial [Vibrio parahaemolyticus]
ACTLYLDRRWFENHLIDRIRLYREHKGEDAQPFLGPAIWWRPWLLATGVLLGAACAVKWSGIYFLAFFGVYTVLADMFMRRRYGVFAWYSAA